MPQENQTDRLNVNRLPAVSTLTDLQFSEQLCLWSIRFWADHFKRHTHPHQILRDAYRLAGAPEAMPDMDGFMSILVSGLFQPMDVRCLKCAGISEDEFLVMEALALSQRKLEPMARTALESLLQPAALRIALPVLGSWAANLNRAGHAIPFRQWVPEISDPLVYGDEKPKTRNSPAASSHVLH